MASVAENLVATTEQVGFRRFGRSRNQSITPSDPNPQIPSSIIQPARCKSTLSSLFLSTFTNNNNNTSNSNSNGNGNGNDKGSSMASTFKPKKKNFTSATFRGLGCAASPQVSAPEAVRSSADWQEKRVRKKKQRNPHRKKNHQGMTTTTTANPTSVVVGPDVWCSPGIAFVADAASVDCVESRRPVAGRGRVDVERMNHRERSYTARRTANIEEISLLDSPYAFETMFSGADVYGARHYRHSRHRSPGGLSEIMMFQSSLLFEGRSDRYDQYRDWQLDVDNMSYEELLELGDRIGYVSTGLREDEIFRCLRKTNVPSHSPTKMDWKCSICQEEYEADSEVGRLDCGHSFHIRCIKQWLLQKNACPVCKAVASVQ